MSQDDRDFDEFLRRLLREEADAVQPADDGLERIRARLTRPRPLALAWVMAAASDAWHRVLGAAWSAAAWSAAAWSAARTATLSGTAPARLRSLRRGRPLRWRSPVMLAAAAVVAVTATVLALTPLPRQAVSGTASLLFRSLGGVHGGRTAGQGGSGQAEGGGSAQPVPGASSSPPARHARRRPPASPSPSAVPSPTPDPEPSASASPTPSASPGPTPTPCPTLSASPSPGSTTDPGSGACPTPTPTPSPTTGPTTGPTSSPVAPDPALQ